MTAGSPHSVPTFVPTVLVPRALLRDLMTALYRRGMDESDPLMQQADGYAYTDQRVIETSVGGFIEAVTHEGDPRDPRPCTTCGEEVRYDGWASVHYTGPLKGYGEVECAFRAFRAAQNDPHGPLDGSQ